jgi:hypothetical protein
MPKHRYFLIALMSIAIGVSAWGALAPVNSASSEQVYTIPHGTWARRTAGDMIEILPSEIHLTIGVKDILVLHNEDDVPHLFGPVLIMPGQRFRLPFRRASTYQFACSLHVNGQLDVIVEPMPVAGWPRLRWRAAAITKHGEWL